MEVDRVIEGHPKGLQWDRTPEAVERLKACYDAAQQVTIARRSPKAKRLQKLLCQKLPKIRQLDEELRYDLAKLDHYEEEVQSIIRTYEKFNQLYRENSSVLVESSLEDRDGDEDDEDNEDANQSNVGSGCKMKLANEAKERMIEICELRSELTKRLLDRAKPEKQAERNSLCIRLRQKSNEAKQSFPNVSDEVTLAEVEHIIQVTVDAVTSCEKIKQRLGDNSEEALRDLSTLAENLNNSYPNTLFWDLRNPDQIYGLSEKLLILQEAFQAHLKALSNSEKLEVRFKTIQKMIKASDTRVNAFLINGIPARLKHWKKVSKHLKHIFRALDLHKVPSQTFAIERLLANFCKSNQRRDILDVKLAWSLQKLKVAKDPEEHASIHEKRCAIQEERDNIYLCGIFEMLREFRTNALAEAATQFQHVLVDERWQRKIGITNGAMYDLGRIDLWLENTRISDFTFVRPLSSRSNSHVSLVNDAENNPLVLKQFLLTDDDSSQQFTYQVSALAHLASPHICSIHGLFVENMRIACILMPFHPRSDLSVWIPNNIYAKEDVRKQIAVGILSGVQQLHKHGLVHCNLTPSNIFLTQSLVPVIGDFDHLQHINAFMHRSFPETDARYQAPEVLERTSSDLNISPAIDMFAIGAILEDLFPIQKGSMQELIRQLKLQDPCGRLTVDAAIAHPALDCLNIDTLKPCLICLDTVSADFGASCNNLEHFFCSLCLSQCIAQASSQTTNIAVGADGSMCCAIPNCNGKLSCPAIAAQVPEEDFETIVRLIKSHVLREQLPIVEQEVQRRLQEALASNENERIILQHYQFIQNNILCMSCPRCKTVFADFDGCTALKCLNQACQGFFCAWCLTFAGNTNEDAHRHVATCPANLNLRSDVENGDPFFPQNLDLVKRAWALVRRTRLIEYTEAHLASDFDMRKSVFQKLAPFITIEMVGERLTILNMRFAATWPAQ